MVVQPYPLSIFRTFSSSQMEILCTYWTITPHSPSPPDPGNHDLFSLFMEKSYNIWPSKWLASFTPHRVFRVHPWASLVAQWLRIHLAVSGAAVQSMVQEDPTCCKAAKPVCYNYWPRAPEPVLYKRSHCNEKSTHKMKSSPRLLQLEKAHM